MVEEPAKKFAVGDMPPSPTTSNPISSTTTSHKKPTRHHVKRRSSGRVHVTKLAPMARAHTPQPTNEDDDNFEDVEQHQQQQQQHQHAPRKPMKRSHSNKSIHRLSSNDPHRKVNLSGFTMTSKSTAAAPQPSATAASQTTTQDSPPITPTEQQTTNTTTDSTCIPQVNTKSHASATPVPPTKSLSSQKSKPITSPSFQVSHQSPAAPLAQILNATANTLVTPDKPALANLTTSSTSTTGAASTGGALMNTNGSKVGSSKSKHLYSRFVQQQGNSRQESTQGHHQQQQDFHQHQQHQHQHQHHSQQQIHHHNYQHQEQKTPITSADDLARANLAIASDHMDKEYQIIQDYHDPMVASLTRCMQQRHQQKQHQRNIGSSKPTSTQLQLHRLAQMGAQQRTFSSSILPTMATLSLQSPSNSTAAALLPSPTTSRFNLGTTDGTPTAASNCQQQQQQHMEHRQMARQRHQRLKAGHLSSPNHYTVSTSSSSDNKQAGGRWSAGAFLDRMFYGAS